MRLVFFGSPEFALPALERLAAAPEHEVVAVVSQPDRPRGRGLALRPSPVSAAALARGLALLRPERVGDPAVADALRALAPQLGVVVAFGQFLPRLIRELPERSFLVNAHASLLPRHRGAAPIARAILAGDTETGISVMRVEREMDAGPVALVRATPIRPDENAGELGARLAQLAADALADALAEIEAGRAVWREQEHRLATLAPKLGPEDQALDWREPASHLARRVRALAPSPGARCRLGGEALRILAARAEPGAPDREPGRVRAHAGEPLRIATGNGWLAPQRLQRAGGKPLDVDAYLRGRPIPDGAQLDG